MPHPSMPSVIAFVLLCVVAAVAAWTDWKSHKIYNWLTVPAMLAGLLLWTVTGYVAEGGPGALAGLKDAFTGLLAGAVPFAIIFFVFGGVGGGDVYFMGAVGAIGRRWELVLGTAVYGFAILLVMALTVMLRRRVVKQTLRRVFNAAVTTAAGVKPAIPDDGPRIPLGVAFGIGALIAGVEYLLGVHFPWSG